VQVHEYLVLKDDGSTEHFPVLDGDAAEALLQASSAHRADGYVVAVTEDAYIRVHVDVAENVGLAIA
jgi:hypothetical protein